MAGDPIAVSFSLTLNGLTVSTSINGTAQNVSLSSYLEFVSSLAELVSHLPNSGEVKSMGCG